MSSIFNSNRAHSHLNRPKIKKRHWCLGSFVILAGSWITHSTTATVLDEFTEQQSIAFAKAMPTNNGLFLNGGMPDELFVDPMKIAKGPISANAETTQSPSAHIFQELQNELFEDESLVETSYLIKRGDTLGSIFKKLDYDLALPHYISKHDLGKQLVSLSVGKKLTFRSDEELELKQIAYPVNALQELTIDLEANSVVDASIDDLPYHVEQRSISTEITSSLYEAALEAGLSNNLVMEMVRIFGWDIDFVLDIRAGDSFHVIYDEHMLNETKLSDGNILAAEFTTQGNTHRAVRFEDADGQASFYTPEGESMLGTFLRSPVEFSRISSRFGKRKHPILKTWRAHKGVDYAASRGVPIRATADGKVIHAGKKGGYGKTVVLRHAGRFSTLYAHMNGYAKGVRSGSRIKQGDIIGYVGSTGLATGPHLHYEFRLDGVHRNPLTFKTPKAGSVSAELLPRFKLENSSWMAKLDKISNGYRMARAKTSQGQNSDAF